MIATDQFGDKMDAVSVGSSFLDDSEDFDIGVDEQEDLDSTIHNDATSVSGEVDKPQESIAAKESRQVAAAKRVAIVVLLVFAGAAGYVTFSFTERGLRDDFKSEVSHPRLMFVEAEV